VVCDRNDRLFNLVTYKLNLVLNLKFRVFLSTLGLVAGNVPHAKLDCARVPLLAVLAQVLELNSFGSISADGDRSLKGSLSPALGSSVQRIRSVVGSELVRLSVQALNLGILDAVGHAANGLAKEGRVFGLVGLRGRETLHNVVPRNAEFLDDGALRQECKGVLGAHFCFVVWVGVMVMQRREREREKEREKEKREILKAVRRISSDNHG
jgi:hypothetical protein